MLDALKCVVHVFHLYSHEVELVMDKQTPFLFPEYIFRHPWFGGAHLMTEAGRPGSAKS